MLTHTNAYMLTHIHTHTHTHILTQSWHALVQLAGSEGERETQDTLLLEEASLLVQQIFANIVAYCRVAMTMGGTTSIVTL